MRPRLQTLHRAGDASLSEKVRQNFRHQTKSLRITEIGRKIIVTLSLSKIIFDKNLSELILWTKFRPKAQNFVDSVGQSFVR